MILQMLRDPCLAASYVVWQIFADRSHANTESYRAAIFCPHKKLRSAPWETRHDHWRNNATFQWTRQPAWNAYSTADTIKPHNKACSKASGLTPPRWLCRSGAVGTERGQSIGLRRALELLPCHGLTSNQIQKNRRSQKDLASKPCFFCGFIPC